MAMHLKKIQRKRKATLLAFCLLSAIPLIASAGYDVDKVRMFLSLTRPVDTLKVSNPGVDNKPINLQTQLFSWTQKDGEDAYYPSNDLIVSPPMMRIAPAKTQLLRVGWRAPSPLTTEKAYRIYLQDISSYTPLTETGVRVKVKLGVPIFVLPASPIYKLAWQVKGSSGKSVTLNATNSGNAHVQVISANLTTADGQSVGSYLGGAYIFPGQSKDITFNMTNTGVKNVVIKVDTDSSPMQSNITLP